MDGITSCCGGGGRGGERGGRERFAYVLRARRTPMALMVKEKGVRVLARWINV